MPAGDDVCCSELLGSVTHFHSVGTRTNMRNEPLKLSRQKGWIIMWDEVNVPDSISMWEGSLNSNHEQFGLNSFLFDVEWQLKGTGRVVVAYKL